MTLRSWEYASPEYVAMRREEERNKKRKSGRDRPKKQAEELFKRPKRER